MKDALKTFIVLLFFSISMNSYAKTTSDLQIGGAYYKKMIQVKDVIADVLPPPAFIVESYLMSFLLLNEVEKDMSDKNLDSNEMVRINKLIENLRQLKEGVSENGELEGYFKRIEIWTKYLSDSNSDVKRIKELLIQTSVTPAKEFYRLLDEKFIPALKSGDISQAKKIHFEMGAAFYRHRLVIEDVVAQAKKEVMNLELQTKKTGVNSSVRGPLYGEILLMKDLISDILPPPSFIIESYLAAWEMVYTAEREGVNSKAFEKIAKEEKMLNSNYIARHDYWLKNLKNKKLRVLLTETSYSSAIKFFDIYSVKFIVELQKNNIIGAKKLLDEVMTPLYQSHRKSVDQLVFSADEEARKIQGQMAVLFVLRH